MIYCKNCSKELQGNATFCANCGTHTNATPIQAQPVYVVGQTPPSKKTNGLAISGFVLGCVAFITMGITSVIGFILSVISLRIIKQRQQDGRGLAIAGIVLNGFFVLIFVSFVLAGQSLMWGGMFR